MAANRRFCNKIYQATKYVLGKMGDDFVPRETSKKTGRESLAERWILHKMSVAARQINAALEAREFSRSTQIVYQYWYEQMCDVFIVRKMISHYMSRSANSSCRKTRRQLYKMRLRKKSDLSQIHSTQRSKVVLP
jgi:valyl-tRNA synthetase